MVDSPGPGHQYWSGATQAELRAIHDCLREIKDEMRDLREQIVSLRLWRARVLGIAAAVAVVVSVALDWMRSHWR